MLNVTLYRREHCELCDQAKKDLQELEHRFPHHLAEVDIDSDPALKEKYGDQIPVLEIGPYKLRAPITPQALEMTLGAANDRRGQLEKMGGEKYQERLRKGETISRSDRIYFWITQHYLALINGIVFIYVGLPFLAPTLMKIGAELPAKIIYTIYSPLCHQFAFRSFFLFGEQPYYPLKEAGVAGVKTLEQVTGFQDLANPFSVSRLYARQFIGNAALGYKVAFCERDVAIYAAIVLFGLIYGVARRWLPALHWILWFLIGIVPIGIDGFYQLLSQFNWPWLATYLPYYESTPFMRVLTGGLFGFMTAWFAFPALEESIKDTREVLIKKFAVAK
ncbi:MAG TPA: glutaredoxin family protein [Anaerolineales bacterium]|nr:glutaredoxin family protein [Anaerolineales bacterium]